MADPDPAQRGLPTGPDRPVYLFDIIKEVSPGFLFPFGRSKPLTLLKVSSGR